MYKARCEVCLRKDQDCEQTVYVANGLQFMIMMCAPCFMLLKEKALADLRVIHAKAFKEIAAGELKDL